MKRYYLPNPTQMRSSVKGDDRRPYRSPWWILVVRGLAVALLAIGFFAALFIIAEVLR